MTLAVVAAPETESDLVVMLGLLRSLDIPYFVHGTGFGGLFPGPQIGSYNSRRIMVPASRAEEASKALAVFLLPSVALVEDAPTPAVGWAAKLRVVLETLLLGWFVPRRSPRD